MSFSAPAVLSPHGWEFHALSLPVRDSIVKEKYKDHPSIKAFCVELRGKGVINPHLFSTQADIAIEEGNKQEASEASPFLFFRFLSCSFLFFLRLSGSF